ncbi:MAG TPA: hypothetical protein PKX31_12595 [Chitinophagaceae bacterium]|nr:hypothetical protein [Chitinophagaceae bacterium]
MKTIIFLFAAMITLTSSAQNKPYYYQIPDVPTTYTPATVAARMVDGLGFRYFWATEGLTEKDIAYKPTEDSRTSLETLQHIDGLTFILLNAVNKKSTIGSSGFEKLTFEELRTKTLLQIQQASEILKKPDANLEDFDMIFERTNGKQEYPFWNLVNGPIADALWHVGQIVTFRRSSGNPLPKGVNVLQGTKTN